MRIRWVGLDDLVARGSVVGQPRAHASPRCASQPLTSRTSARLIGTSHAGLVRGLDDGAVDHVDLGPAPRLEVLQHRALRRAGLLEQPEDRRRPAPPRRSRSRARRATADRSRARRRRRARACLVRSAKRAGGHARERRGRERRGVEDQLLPDLGPDRRGDASPRARRPRAPARAARLVRRPRRRTSRRTSAGLPGARPRRARGRGRCCR